jgi:hypothetical protein
MMTIDDDENIRPTFKGKRDAWPLLILMVFFLVCLQTISFPPANRWADDNAWPES